MVKFFFWNCRGIANAPTRRHLCHLVSTHNLDFIFLAEPKSPSPINFLPLQSFSYNVFFQSPPSSSSFHQHSPIWCLAKSSPSFKIIHFKCSPHHLILSISTPSNGLLYLLTAVHAPCDLIQRRNFWATILASSRANTPWGIIGDFNAVLNASERWSTTRFQPASSKAFNNFISFISLRDIGFSGNSFTGSNNGQGRTYVTARLDRMLVNQAWLDVFKDPTITHLTRQALDHNPIMLSHREFINRR